MKLSLSIFLLVFLSLFSVFPASVFGSGFQLKSVGNLNVEGATFKQLWYTNGNVTFKGVALTNTAVTATIDSSSATVTADASGNWSYHATLAGGDHQVSFNSSGSTIAFTLTIGDLPAGAGSLQKSEMPPVGIITPTIIMLWGGIFLLLSSFFLRKVYLRV